MIILEFSNTLVAPIAGLNAMGAGGTTIFVNVPMPAFTFLLSSITVVPEILIAIVVLPLGLK
jgi:hypothetical protein